MDRRFTDEKCSTLPSDGKGDSSLMEHHDSTKHENIHGREMESDSAIDPEVYECLKDIIEAVVAREAAEANQDIFGQQENSPIDDKLVICDDLLDDVLGLTRGSSVLINDAPLPELTDQDLASNGVIDTDDMEVGSTDSENGKRQRKAKDASNHRDDSSAANSSTLTKNEEGDDIDDEDVEAEEHERSDRTHAAFHLPTNLNIREGNDYQCPVQDWSAVEKQDDSIGFDEEPDRDVCLWMPNESIPPQVLSDYCSVALGVYSIDQDRALFILKQCNYDIEKAKIELSKRRIIKQPWNADDITIFKQGIQTYGKRFRRIRQLLPHKTVKELISFYYDNKKTLDLRSCVDAYIEEHGDNISDSEEEIDTVKCAEMCVCENCGWAVNEVMEADGLKVCNTCCIYWRNHLRHRIANSAENERKIACPEEMEDVVNEFVNFAADENENVGEASTSRRSDFDDDIEILTPPVKRCENFLKNVIREQLQAKGECVRMEHAMRLQYKEILSEGVEQYRITRPPTPPTTGRPWQQQVWTDMEKWKALFAFQRYGKDFATVSSLIGTKTVDVVKAFYQEKQPAIDKMISQSHDYYMKLMENHDYEKDLAIKNKTEVVDLE